MLDVQNSQLKVPTVSAWLIACRPKTLPAAVVPVAIGTALAWHEGTHRWFPAIVCLVFALLVQIGTNFANDYFDYIHGADNVKRVGPTRAVAAGLLSPTAMWRATLVVLAMAFGVGLILIAYGGFGLLLVGATSIICAVAYTGGPYPLGYNGLGDVFVILFFGLVAVAFTHYVQAGHFIAESFIAGLGCGLMINNILVVNNYRDCDTDCRARKHTLVVRWGKRFALYQYFGSFLVAVVGVPVFLILFGNGSLSLLLPSFMVPVGLVLVVRLQATTAGHDFNKLLGLSALCVVVYGAMFVVGIVLGGQDVR